MAWGKVHYFDSGGLELDVNDRVQVESTSGMQEGFVIVAPNQVLYSEVKGSLDKVLNKLNPGQEVEHRL